MESAYSLLRALHMLDETEGTLFVLVGVGGIRMALVEELHDVKTALVDVEVDVAHLEVRGHQLPLPHIGVRLLDGGPCACADAASVRARIDRDNLDLSAISLHCEDNAADWSAILDDAQSLDLGPAERLFNVFSRKDRRGSGVDGPILVEGLVDE